MTQDEAMFFQIGHEKVQVTKEIKMDKSDGNKMKKISFKGTIKKVKKTTHRMGENTCKSYI